MNEFSQLELLLIYEGLTAIHSTYYKSDDLTPKKSKRNDIEKACINAINKIEDMIKNSKQDFDDILESSNDRLRELAEQGHITPKEILEILPSKVTGCYDWPSGKEYVEE